MTRQTNELTTARLWQQLDALSKIYGTVADAAPMPWHLLIGVWGLSATLDSPTVTVWHRDAIAGEIGKDYAEVYAPGMEDAAQQLRRDLAEHVYQFHRARRPATP